MTVAKSSKLNIKSEQYKLHFNPETYSAVRELYAWIDSETMRLTTKARDTDMETAYRLVNQANGILKVKEHIEMIKRAAGPSE